MYFISTFFDIFVFIFDKHKFSFYISTALWLRKYDDYPDSASYQVLGAMDPANVETERFDLRREHVMMCHVIL